MKNNLVVEQVSKNYGVQKAVDNISFTLKEGSIFGLLGPNGAGKTTLLRMITGIVYPDAGNIYIDNQSVDLNKIREQIGYMPEERGLYKKMKVGEQTLYLAQLKGLSKTGALKQIKYWFEKLGMQDWWNKKVEDLSKGMSQKLQFVVTVLHQPKLIILDEPFSGLDPLNAQIIKEQIFELAQQGCTIIFSTHRMEQVEEICNHILLINKGQTLYDGTVKQIKQNLKENKFSLQLPTQIQLETNAIFTITDVLDSQYILQINPNYSSNDVLRFLLEQPDMPAIQGFSEVLPSLNEVFIQLVEKN